MDELIEFFQESYGWSETKAKEKADWMSRIQTGADLSRKQVIASEFRAWKSNR